MQASGSAMNSFMERLKRASDSDAMMGLGVVMILSVMLLPMPSTFLDMLLAVNIASSLVIMLTAVYSLKPLDFAIFPSVLLITTLFRLALNVASTRLILLRGHEGPAAAGHIINAFGQFVVGGNYAVGFILFVILVIINFMVITKGTERISEVTARFTLDALPGKQMSIDADLNSGMISDVQARRRREEVRREADFYGTMDGASKFVRGDAIAGILITFINVVGGLTIGVLQNHMNIVDALKNYTLLSIGDGLVSQIPALIISSSAGILVSRAESNVGMGKAFGEQFSIQPKPLVIAGAMLCVLALVPGFPAIPLILVGAGLLYAGLALLKRKEKSEVPREDQEQAQAASPPEFGELPPPLDILELEVGYGLIPLVDESQKGDLLPRIKAIRQQLAMEYGIIVPALHVRDNLQLKPAEYRVLLKGNVIGKGELMIGHYLALSSGDSFQDIKGVPTKDPTFGLPAVWIPEKEYESAVGKGYTVIDLSTIAATHLTELFKRHADELLSRQTTQNLLDNLAASQPKLIEELVPGLLSVGSIQKVLQNLIRERVSIRDIQTVCETLADHAAIVKDPEILTEYVRQALARTITRPYEGEGRELKVLTLQQDLEERISKSIQKTDQGAFLALEPDFLKSFIQATNVEVKKVLNMGFHPVILCSPMVRRHLKKLLERFLSDVVVLSHNELSGHLEIQSIGIIRLTHAN